MLENQSNEMDTIVETFFIEEVTELIGDGEKLAEWNKYVEELGLTGQTKLVKPEKSPIPFMFLKANMVEVFKTLCPNQCNVEDFKTTTIPLEIMKVISLAKNECYFERIQVWADDKDPDPCVVGLTGRWYSGNYTNTPEELRGKYFDSKEEAIANGVTDEMFKSSHCWFITENYYLLGKWADVKHSFAELIEMAKTKYIREKSMDYKKQIKEYTNKLNDVIETAEQKFFGGQWVND